MKGLLAIALTVWPLFIFAQHSLRLKVVDGMAQPLPGANVAVERGAKGAIADEQGIVELQGLPAGSTDLRISFVGYRDTVISVILPHEEMMEVVLVAVAENLDEIIVSSTRTDQHIQDLPLKVEVLGQSEMNEESTLVPGTVASILGDLAVITIQRTNPINGNDAIRLQGLDPQYTLIARDGLPLYGGFSGSLGVLSIPPLDLKQVEIIKGSVSTLYGGGAIAGMINLISRGPTPKPAGTILLNVTTLKEKNLNTFFSGRLGAKTGYTFFAGGNVKSAVDVNDDGFSEVPQQENYTLHPRVFLQPGSGSTLNIGFTATVDNRRTGDLQAVTDGPDARHSYLRTDKTFRNVLDIQFNKHYSAGHVIGFKGAGSAYRRALAVPLKISPGFSFLATQYASYSEASDRRQIGKHTLVAGANLITESLRQGSTATVAIRDYDYVTVGIFAQDDWDITNMFSVEGGLRLDRHNVKGIFFLPRVALFYKPSTNLSLRLASGAGYKTPVLLALTDPDPQLINNDATVSSERATGANADVNYKAVWLSEVEVSLNQAFYYGKITHPLYVIRDTIAGTAFMENQPFTAKTFGTDTYAQLTYRRWELYLGYNHTEAYQDFDGGKNAMPFNPKDKFSSTFAYAEDGKWRTGIEASFMANQYVTDHLDFYASQTIYPSHRVPNIWFWAAMLEREFDFGSIVVNVENLFDARQAKFEDLFKGPAGFPEFKPVWGPLEGRVINLSLKINL
jgi:iron complex outermembrane receptor protein/outer membrane receptor for ferrienterochelin and colicins